MSEIKSGLKRPSDGPLVELNNAMQSVFKQYREHRAYSQELEYENRRLRTENLSLKTLVEDAKKQQSKLLEVPQFVAKWLDRKPPYMINGDLPVEIIEWSQKQTGYADIGMNINHLLKLKINGYTVAKEKRFYLREKNTGFYLNKGKNAHLELVSNPYFDKNNEFIQQEIDSMETGSYEQIEVEEEGE